MLQVFTDPCCREHRSPPGFPEQEARLARVTARLEREAWPIDVGPGGDLAGGELEAVLDAAAAAHDDRYVARFRAAVERGDGLIDSADNPLSPGTWRAACAAVATALRAVDWMMAAPGRTAFAAVRPPGHHAEHAMAMGFCYFNNVAVAAEHLIRRHGVERVAIFDFDVHHGNGTQHIFEERADVFYASTHQYPFYPGTGAAGETGRGAGRGATLNVPLPAGTGDAVYERAFSEQVYPALRRFAPDVLLLSAGFDAWQDDPLGGMRVSADGFAAWGSALGELADELCAGRTASLLEGGYDLSMLGELVVRYLAGQSGEPSGS